jgi:hypothetical protein
MATRLEDEYPAGRLNPPSGAYPDGSFKNETTPGVSDDGTPVDDGWLNNREGFFQGLLALSGITPSGTPDTVLVFDYLKALGIQAATVHNMASDADYTLTIIQSNNIVVEITDTGVLLTAARNIVVPDQVRGLIVKNNTAQDLTFKTSAGTGVLVAPGETAPIHSNGTDVVPSGSSGKVKTTVITVSNPTWSPDPAAKALRFTAIGGGGGSGGVDGQGAGTNAGSAGAGAGGTSIQTVSGSLIESSYNITIGAVGIGGATGANSGAAGGTTTIVSTNVNLSCFGGSPSSGETGSAGVVVNIGGSGGLASGGDTNHEGGGGGVSTTVNGEAAAIGKGGESTFGDSSRANNGAVATASANFGAGGSGVNILNATTDLAGTDGTQGAVIVEEFF